LVAQVVDGGKERKVGGSFDPEKEVGKSVPRMVKVGGVRWEEGIGGVENALREAGVGFCDGVTILVLSTYATGNDCHLLRKRVSLFCTKA